MTSTDARSEAVESRREPVADVRAKVVARLVADHVPEEHANWTADWLIDSDLTGVVSHGLRQLPRYVERMRNGGTNPQPEMTIVRGREAAFVVDGDNGLGPVVATWTMHRLIERARSVGASTATVFHSNHLGALAYLARLAAAERMAVFACQNTRRNTIVWGGRHAGLGNNPVMWGLPLANGASAVLDIASSRMAQGNVKHAENRGLTLPEGMALDEHGEPTTDPSAALRGGLMPFGEHKGSGIAFFAGALSGVLSGANFGRAVPNPSDFSQARSIGHYIAVVDVEALIDWDVYLERFDEYVTDVKTGPDGAVDAAVRVPGERAHAQRQQAEADGILVEDAVAALLDRGEIVNELDVGARP